MNRVYPSRIEWENEPSTNTPINETNLNKMDYAIYEIDGRVVTFDLTKANQSDLLQTVKNVTYDTETGIFTFTFWNGSTVEADLNIEKIPVSFRLMEIFSTHLNIRHINFFPQDKLQSLQTYPYYVWLLNDLSPDRSAYP